MLKLQYFGHLMPRATHLKRPWCWERMKAGEEGDNRGWDGWMISSTQWTRVWANSGTCWWTGKHGRLQSMESQSRTQLSNGTTINPVPWATSHQVFCSLHDTGRLMCRFRGVVNLSLQHTLSRNGFLSHFSILGPSWWIYQNNMDTYTANTVTVFKRL